MIVFKVEYFTLRLCPDNEIEQVLHTMYKEAENDYVKNLIKLISQKRILSYQETVLFDNTLKTKSPYLDKFYMALKLSQKLHQPVLMVQDLDFISRRNG